MTRLLTTGWETGDVAEAGATTIGTNGTVTVVNSTPTPRAGVYCLKIGTSGTSLGITIKTFALPAAKTDMWVRFAIYLHPAATTTSEWVIATTQDAAGVAQNCLTWDTVSQVIRARSANSTAGALLATSGTILPPDTWHVVEWRTQITSTSAGITEVWQDGNRVINFSGDNTGTATLNVQFVGLGQCFSALATTTGLYVAFDDIAINDTAGTLNNGRPGDGRVLLLVPSGAGSSAVLARGGTDTGANYSQVNEIPPSLSQYVGSSTAGDRDLYAMGNLGVAVSSINVVEAIVLAQNSDAGAGQIAPTIKSGATTNEATAIGLGTSAGYATSRWETDPNTAAAWTSTAVDALEAGVTVR